MEPEKPGTGHGSNQRTNFTVIGVKPEYQFYSHWRWNQSTNFTVTGVKPEYQFSVTGVKPEYQFTVAGVKPEYQFYSHWCEARVPILQSLVRNQSTSFTVIGMIRLGKAGMNTNSSVLEEGA